MAVLKGLWRKRDFSLRPFDLSPLEFYEAAGVSDELLLQDVVVAVGACSDVTPAAQPLPTAGELRTRIERHLHRVEDSAPTPDAAAELREALSELRRSLG